MTNKTIVDKIVVGTPIAKVVEVGFDSADVIGIVDSDYVQARQVDFYRDSAFVTTIVDSDYVQLHQTPQDFEYSSLTGAPTALSSFTNDTSYITAADISTTVDSDYIQARQVDFYRDSAFVTTIVDSDYIQARETNDYPNISDLPTLPLP